MKIEGSKILVTGGAGLIGSTTIDQLLANEKPAEIVILDHMSRGSTRTLENALKDYAPRDTGLDFAGATRFALGARPAAL